MVIKRKTCLACHGKGQFITVTLLDDQPMSLHRLKFCFGLPDYARYQKVTLCDGCLTKFKDYAEKSYFFQALNLVSIKEAEQIRASKLAVGEAERRKGASLKKMMQVKFKESNDNQLKCVACQLKFKTPNSYNKHKSSCTPVTYYHCKHCIYKARYFSFLSKHLQKVHAGVTKTK